MRRLPYALLLTLSCALPTARPASVVAGSDPLSTTTISSAQVDLGTSGSGARIEVTEAEGMPRDQIQKLFEPAVAALQRCTSERGGTIVLRVIRENGVLRVFPAGVGIIPGDPAARACATDALSEVYLEQTGSNVGGPTFPPPGFTSLLTVAW